MYPEHKDKTLKVGNHNNITTSKGKTLAVKDSDGWRLVSVGGRPTQDRLTHDLRVRVTDSQYKKLEGYSEARGQSKPELVRDLIDEL